MDRHSLIKKIIDFIIFQIKAIRRDGFLQKARQFWKITFTALWTFVRIVPIICKAIPLILAVRVLRPLITIRFGSIDSSRLGHFAFHTEIYLCNRDAGLDNNQTYDIFYYDRSVCNQQLKIMWDRLLHINSLSKYLQLVNRCLPGHEPHEINLTTARDVLGLFERIPAHLNFTAEEEEQGQKALREMGIPEGAPFICFHNRDSVYLSTVSPHIEWNYHDYRDSSIYNFIPAMEELTSRGYYAIRMGAFVKEEIASTNPMLIDYSTKYRNDFMDIFLTAKCYFYIGDPCGLHTLPTIFRRPFATTNSIQFEHLISWFPNKLLILKKLFLRKENRLMTFREIIESNVGKFDNTLQFEEAGIEIISNTPEEITDLAIEMDERLKGTWQASEEDEWLQKRFWSFFNNSELHGKIVSRAGAEFLRQNRALLD
jgi:putative glycosyltransferase (TIGR04372 family)